jgi:exodeoxyribonuclease-5
MLDEINMKSILLAPTGRAAKVLSAYAAKQAFTIH